MPGLVPIPAVASRRRTPRHRIGHLPPSNARVTSRRMPPHTTHKRPLLHSRPRPSWLTTPHTPRPVQGDYVTTGVRGPNAQITQAASPTLARTQNRPWRGSCPATGPSKHSSNDPGMMGTVVQGIKRAPDWSKLNTQVYPNIHSIPCWKGDHSEIYSGINPSVLESDLICRAPPQNFLYWPCRSRGTSGTVSPPRNSAKPHPHPPCPV